MNPMTRSLVAAAGMMLMAGCAAPTTTTSPTTPSHNHPADPRAAEAPIPAQSGTLAVNAAEAPPSAGDAELGMQHGDIQHDRVQHDGMDHGTAGMSHDTPSTRPGGSAAPSAPTTTPTIAPAAAAALYTCPMHKEVVSAQPGRCPKCGMKLVQGLRKGGSR